MWNRHLGIAIGALLLVGSFTGCRTAPKSGVGESLVAESLVLVNPEGEPWLVMHSGGPGRGQGISMLDGGDEIAFLGVLDNSETKDPGAETFRVPVLRMESADGNGLITLGVGDDFATVSIVHLEGPGVTLVARPEEFAITVDPTDMAESEDGYVRSRLIFRGSQVLLEITREGEVQTIDLSAIGAPATPPSRPPR